MRTPLFSNPSASHNINPMREKQSNIKFINTPPPYYKIQQISNLSQFENKLTNFVRPFATCTSLF